MHSLNMLEHRDMNRKHLFIKRIGRIAYIYNIEHFNTLLDIQQVRDLYFILLTYEDCYSQKYGHPTINVMVDEYNLPYEIVLNIPNANAGMLKLIGSQINPNGRLSNYLRLAVLNS